MSYTKSRASGAVARRRANLAVRGLSGGLCLDATQTAIAEHQSPDMKNLQFRDNLLVTRDGQRLFAAGFEHSQVMSDLLGGEAALRADNAALMDDAGQWRLQTAGPGGVYASVSLTAGRRYIFRVFVGGSAALSVWAEQASGAHAAEGKTVDTAGAGSSPEGEPRRCCYCDVAAPASGAYKFVLHVADAQSVSLELSNTALFDATEIYSGMQFKTAEQVALTPTGGQTCTLVETFPFDVDVAADWAGAPGTPPPTVGTLYGSCTPVFGIGSSAGIGGTTCALHIGSSLFLWDGDTAHAPKLAVYGALRRQRSVMFAFGDTLYVMDGAGYWQYGQDGAFAPVEPYAPIVYINCGPDGANAEAYEDWNLLGRAFWTWFNIDGRVYTLPFGSLADDALTVELHGQALAASQYTVDRAAGKITLLFDPPTAGLNELRVKAYLKAADCAEDVAAIYACTLAQTFGGYAGGGTRVILSGDDAKPGLYYRSGLQNPAYFPDMEYDILGAGDQKVRGMAHQYGYLVFFLEASVYMLLYSATDTGGVRFYSKLLNGAVGCDIPGSIRLIDNRLVFANTSGGVYIIDSTNIESEKNIRPISANINGSASIGSGLFAVPREALQQACGADTGSQYWLCADGKAFVWDYAACSYYDTGNPDTAQRRLVWYLFDGIGAERFLLSRSGQLCHYSASRGLSAFEPGAYDYGAPVEAYGYTKHFSFNLETVRKLLYHITAVCGSGGYGSFELDILGDGEPFASYSVPCGSFAWDRVTWDPWSWEVGKSMRYEKYRAARRRSMFFSFGIRGLSGAVNLYEIIADFAAIK